MDIITYALCKKLAAGAVSGISNIEVQDNTLIITQNNGSQVTMDFPVPEDGVSIEDVKLDTDGSLICYLSNGTTIDAGTVPAVKGDPGYTPVKGVDYFTEAEIEELKAEVRQEVIDESFSLEII